MKFTVLNHSLATTGNIHQIAASQHNKRTQFQYSNKQAVQCLGVAYDLKTFELIRGWILQTKGGTFRDVPTVVGSGRDQPPLSLKWPPLIVTKQYKIISKVCKCT